MTDQPSYRLITAGVILIVYFAVAAVVLYNVIGTTVAESTWSQVVFVFNAIGALATTAAGVLLGAEVQQANVRGAQRDSQAHAAAAARKDQAALDALASLDQSGAAAGASDGVSNARSILQRSLVSEAPTLR
jgi:hypothetical protein